MDMDFLELEKLEKRYFDFINLYLVQDCIMLSRELKLLIADKKDIGLFAHYLLKPIFKESTIPLTDPWVNFETPDAFIHVEVKNAVVDNPADYKGKVQLGRNQTSYHISRFQPNLPSVYKEVNLPTLTYVIQIVHGHMSPVIYSLSVICIPNGQLLKLYGEKILRAGKTGWGKATDIRYKYAEEPHFVALTKKRKREIFRIEVLALHKDFSIKQLTGKELPLSPYFIIPN